MVSGAGTGALARRLGRRLGGEAARPFDLLWRVQLLLRGRLIAYLRPYWVSEELQAGSGWVGDDAARARVEAGDLQRDFLSALGLSGVAVATSSGRAAMLLGLRALRRERPDRTEVIIPSYSCRGLLVPILDGGLTPVFADVGHDLNLTRATVVPHVSPRTLAVVVVHLGGKYAEETAAIAALAERHGIAVVEDLCQALGGRSPAGAWGATAALAFYSFGLGKNAMATAGGLVVARRCVDAVREEERRLGEENPARVRARFAFIRDALGGRRLRPVRSLAAVRDALDSSYGYNRISGLDTRLVRHQLARLPEILRRRGENAALLLRALDGVGGISVPGAGGPNVWTKFTVVADTAPAARRIRARLARAGVETETTYTPLHLREFGRPYATGHLPFTEGVWERAFNLPIHPFLGPDQVAHVAAATRRAVTASRAEGR